MKTRFAILILGLLSASVAVGQPASAPLSVAVYDFTSGADSAGDGAQVTALVTASLATDTNLVMFERAALGKALHEQAFGMSGLVSSEAAAKVGEITGVKVLVSGQVFSWERNRVIIVANIIGTENARLFAAKVEGPKDNLEELAMQLSSKIAATITREAADLVTETAESNSARLERIVKGLQGSRRPMVSVSFYHSSGPKDQSFTANTEMGLILQKAGFVVVDANSESKPDVEITGLVINDEGRIRGELHLTRSAVEIKVRDRRTGAIIAMDREEAATTGSTHMGALRSAQARAVDELAARVLPLLAK